MRSDADENVRSMSPQTSPATRAEITGYLAKGRLIHAEVGGRMDTDYCLRANVCYVSYWLTASCCS
jgi:hypothetical protein